MNPLVDHHCTKISENSDPHARLVEQKLRLPIISIEIIRQKRRFFRRFGCQNTICDLPIGSDQAYGFPKNGGTKYFFLVYFMEIPMKKWMIQRHPSILETSICIHISNNHCGFLDHFIYPCVQ